MTETKEQPAAPARLLRIHEAAAEVGLTARSVRYYEEVGLLRPAARSEGDYRLYDDTDVERLRFIKGLRDDAGFSLAEIAQLLEGEAARERGRDAGEAAAPGPDRWRHGARRGRTRAGEHDLVPRRAGGSVLLWRWCHRDGGQRQLARPDHRPGPAPGSRHERLHDPLRRLDADRARVYRAGRGPLGAAGGPGG